MQARGSVSPLLIMQAERCKGPAAHTLGPWPPPTLAAPDHRSPGASYRIVKRVSGRIDYAAAPTALHFVVLKRLIVRPPPQFVRVDDGAWQQEQRRRTGEGARAAQRFVGPGMRARCSARVVPLSRWRAVQNCCGGGGRPPSPPKMSALSAARTQTADRRARRGAAGCGLREALGAPAALRGRGERCCIRDERSLEAACLAAARIKQQCAERHRTRSRRGHCSATAPRRRQYLRARWLSCGSFGSVLCLQWGWIHAIQRAHLHRIAEICISRSKRLFWCHSLILSRIKSDVRACRRVGAQKHQCFG